MHRGYIALWRKFREWEWYSDTVVKSVFIELLLRANHKPTRYKGHKVPRGSVITGINALSKSLKLTPKQIRRALDVLEKGGETARYRASKFSIITVLKYDDYQDLKKTKGKQEGKQRASRGQHLKNVNNENKEASPSPEKGVDASLVYGGTFGYEWKRNFPELLKPEEAEKLNIPWSTVLQARGE